MPTLDLHTSLVVLVALSLGGLVKGATGAGAPVVAIPVIAAFFDVRLAVAVMVTPNFAANTWQLIEFRKECLGGGFTWRFGLAAALGTALGTVLLAILPERALTLIVALSVTAYIGLRLAHPDFRIGETAARRMAMPAGLAAGLLQGAAGISAPIAVSFLNAMRLTRPVFIATISAIFLAMAGVQLPALFAADVMTPAVFAVSLAALVPLLGFMRLGSWLARRLSPKGFDRLTLVLLTGLALRLYYTVLF